MAVRQTIDMAQCIPVRRGQAASKEWKKQVKDQRELPE